PRPQRRSLVGRDHGHRTMFTSPYESRSCDSCLCVHWIVTYCLKKTYEINTMTLRIDLDDSVQPADPERVDEHGTNAVQSQFPPRLVDSPVQPRQEGHHGARRVPNAIEVQQEPGVPPLNQPLKPHTQLPNRSLLEEHLRVHEVDDRV